MTLHEFTWTHRSGLPLAAGVVVGSWAVLAGLVAGVAHLVGGEAVAAPAAAVAGLLAAMVVALLTLAGFLGFVLDRPVRARRPAGSAVPVSRPIA